MSTYEVISIFDPAIDWGAMDVQVLRDYAHSNDAKRDIALLTPYVKTGERPTIYRLRECPNSLWRNFVRPKEPGAAMRALHCCLVSARDFRGSDGAFRPEHDFADRKSKSGIVEDKAMDLVPNSDVDDLAEVALTLSFFQGRTAFGFQLLPMLRERWDELAARLAVVNPKSPAKSSASPSSAGAPTGETPTIESTSASPTDAIAVGQSSTA